MAEEITIGCSSLSAAVPAEEQISAFCIYLRLWFTDTVMANGSRDHRN